jgi:hypothetical protein
VHYICISTTTTTHCRFRSFGNHAMLSATQGSGKMSEWCGRGEMWRLLVDCTTCRWWWVSVQKSHHTVRRSFADKQASTCRLKGGGRSLVWAGVREGVFRWLVWWLEGVSSTLIFFFKMKKLGWEVGSWRIV